MSELVRQEIAPVTASNQPTSDGIELVDRFGRVHRSLRISVTDVCNIRCQYCMPAEGVEFLPSDRQLSFQQIESFVRVVVNYGVRNLRITGGEPLMRPKLYQLIERLSSIRGVEDLGITTNGTLLAAQLPGLVAAGLGRINISLDTLSDATFRRLSRRDGLDRVLEGIEAAIDYPNLKVKLNALVLRDVNLEDVFALIEFAKRRDLELRFIEFMPLDGGRTWTDHRMVGGEELRSLIAQRYGSLRRLEREDEARPSVDYVLEGSGAKLGFIDSVTRPFCGGCDRLRLTADGKIRNCLFGRQEWNVADLLRANLTDSQPILAVLRECLQAKHASHGIAEPEFQPPQRAMYQIGG